MCVSMVIYSHLGGEKMTPENKPKSERVNVFFMPSVLEKIKELADKKGMTVSGFIRFIVLDWLADKMEE